MEAATPTGMKPCDLCGSNDRSLIPESRLHGSGGVYVCRGCGFVYVPERRAADEIAADWEKIYAAGGYTARWPMVEARLTYVAEYYGQLFGWKGKSVLEIGAGEGRFLEMVRDRGAHPVGLEPSSAGCQSMRSKDIFAHHGTIEKCGQVGTFDVIAILWTLENCQDCVGMLRAARSMLTPNGHLIVATGSRILVPFKKPISTYFSKNPPDCHAFRFSPRTLTRAAQVAGMHEVAVNPFKESDWLVAIYGPGVDEPLRTYSDYPDAVLRYFANWGYAWP